ncbi:MAG: hypothetical protein GEU78_15900 [Actinobacteria bacterium]|nr:hypothetical protein [Actinomycetota bacterium]
MKQIEFSAPTSLTRHDDRSELFCDLFCEDTPLACGEVVEVRPSHEPHSRCSRYSIAEQDEDFASACEEIPEQNGIVLGQFRDPRIPDEPNGLDPSDVSIAELQRQVDRFVAYYG